MSITFLTNEDKTALEQQISENVSFAKSQILTEEQKEQARANIGAMAHITSKGAPTTSTEGAVGCLYMDTDTGNMYKCTAVNAGVYYWVSADRVDNVPVYMSANLFDPNRVVKSRYIGEYGYENAEAYTCSHPIPVRNGTKYKYYEQSISNMKYAYCDYAGDILETKNATKETVDGVEYLVFTADRDGWVVVNTDGQKRYKTFMFCEYNAYPTSYVPYRMSIDEKEVEYRVAGKKILHDMGVYAAQNMIDKGAFTAGYLSNGEVKQTSSSSITDYIEIIPGIKYAFDFSLGTYGLSTYKRAVEVYDPEKQYIGNGISGDVIWYTEYSETANNAVGVISCNPSNAKYVRITVRNANCDMAMMVEGDTYPEEYREYGYTLDNMFRLNDTAKAEIAKMLNGSISPLYGKTVAFDGDSIGNGGSAKDGLNGWAGRIGSNNAMTWKNYAVGGGTITNQEGHYCIGDNIDTILSENASLDYLIFEGGTNDADLLGDDGLGTFSTTDYGGNYDTTTFSGAFETMLYKAVTYYPKTKIGYIVAHNMTTTIRRQYFDRAVELCKKWGVPCIDLWHGAHLNKRLTAHFDASLDAQGNIDAGKLYTDGQHLTPAGYEVLTPKIEAWMKTL